jgi:membrane protein required for colicin V production
MSGADWIIVLVILLSAVLAASQGFFYEVISLAGVVVGYLVASWQYYRIADWLAPHLKSPWVGDVAGFLIIFLAVIILAGCIAKLVRWAMKEAGLSWFDRTLGGLFGLLRGSSVVAVVLMCMTAFEPSSKLLTGSELAPYFLVAGRAAIWLAPSELRGRFYQGLDVLHGAHQQR